MKDRIGNLLVEGDKVIAYSHMRTGSSMKRMVQYEGVILGFHKSFIKVKCTEKIYDAFDKEFRVQSHNLFKMKEQI